MAILMDPSEQYRWLFNLCPNAILILDPAEDRIIDANQRAAALCGQPVDTLRSRPLSALLPSALPQLMAFLANPAGWQTRRLGCSHASGATLEVEMDLSLMTLAGNTSTPSPEPSKGRGLGATSACGAHLIAILRDTVAQPSSEVSPGQQQAWLGAIIDSAMDAVVVIDDQRRVVLLNRAAEAAFQGGGDTLLGLGLDRLLSDRFRELLAVTLEEFDRSNWNQHFMWAEGLTAFRTDGEPFPVDTSLAPFVVDSQRYVTLILRDARIRQRAEQRLAHLQHQNARLQAQLRAEVPSADIIGQSAPMQRLFANLEQVADTDANVLILGETGTGKELIARAVHRLSKRKDEIMVTVNCATLSAGLIESELFGHEKGAFTGALARKLGRFELADRGTLFLDEIGELPLDLQAKLLRVLQEGEFERVGGVSVRKVDVRLIAATNRDLGQAAAAGSFREDLYYRLNVFPIAVPPLRERAGDIALLANYFTAQHSKKLGRPIETISPQVQDALAAYHWPGNVRELEHVIERGVILSQGPRLEAGDWLPRANRVITNPRVKTLEAWEREHIQDALQLTNGRVSGPQGAARLLGLKPTTLDARMRKLGIKRATRKED
jgi:PAS domain S-box-containing protein